MNFIAKQVKYAVSGKRQRYIDSNYDLDLTYITDRVIAMGFPGEGVEGMYRNNLDEVSKFLKEKHSSHFMVWNLSEKEYDYSKLDNQVLCFGFPDHHNPPLDLLFQIVKSMDSWIKADAKNVTITHCLAGKGRTGTVIASYFLYAGIIKEPHESLQFFHDRRKEGVTSPSQVRYVEYFDYVLKHKCTPYKKPLNLRKIFFHNANVLLSASLHIQVFEMVSIGPNMVEKKLKHIAKKEDVGTNELIAFSCDVKLEGDALIVCTNNSSMFGSEKIFRFAFHTGFIPMGVLRLKKKDMDDACKNKKLNENFMVDLMFSEVSIDHEKVNAELDQVKHLYKTENESHASSSLQNSKVNNYDDEKSETEM